MFLCVPAVFAWYATPCMSTRMFSMPTRLLDLASSRPTGNLCVCVVFWHVLMLSIGSADVCPCLCECLACLCVHSMCSTGFRGPLAQLHHVLHLQHAPVLSPSPIPAVSLVFSTAEASIWPLDSSAWPFNYPADSQSQVCVFAQGQCYLKYTRATCTLIYPWVIL